MAVIEIRKEVSQEIAQSIDALVINGDGTQQETLEEADAKNADVFVAVTGRDEVNLLSGLVAKNIGVKSVICRVSNPHYKDVFKRLGLDYVISPEFTAAEYIEKLIRRPSMVDIAFLGRKDIEILEFLIATNSKVADMSLREINPKGFSVIAVYRDSKLIIPSGDTILKSDDKVLVLAKNEAFADVNALFTTAR